MHCSAFFQKTHTCTPYESFRGEGLALQREQRQKGGDNMRVSNGRKVSDRIVIGA